MYSRVVFVFYVICFISCGLFKNNSNDNQANLLQQDMGGVKLEQPDWKDNLELSNDELDILTFFVNALKDELPKAYTSAAHFNIYLKGDVSKIEEYVKRFLLKLKDKNKIKGLLEHIKYGRDNPPNVEGRDESLNIDAKEHYKIERRLANVFDNYFMLLNPPSSQMRGNDGELGGRGSFSIGGDPEDDILNEIQKVCYEFRGRTEH
ncbi:hypothetical protein F9Y90_05250 (plasmid) [Borrelia miyamotoi]|uniref:Uncharacterized protein n=1 Tax=Borrelia miyamotoi TaxID=47466 RepID=A0A481YIV7_9SPIR|nr:hypothetical protein [Borrelia miyamotoi]ATQ16571.1 hypothetical protein CNO13_05270 [Borrelia miyamotoi]ATQ16674.1 hypothetical protein CNO13_05840 [Borrelia miyamotoi]QBK63749.1 hypothetical protein EZU68_04900 [Borrelia miyamotoi]QBK65063.1 hypothetical protein EZU69_05035 [Borrelia miyamotoi]QBL99256.1 hypothetical protein EZU71_05140 [Borrelia miyamotoi]